MPAPDDAHYYGHVADLVTEITLIGLVWGILYGVFGAELVRPTDGVLFSFVALFIMAHFFGKIISVCKLPRLTGKLINSLDNYQRFDLGHLIAGMILSNTTSLNFNENIASPLRNIALAIIMLRAGTGIDPRKIKGN